MKKYTMTILAFSLLLSISCTSEDDCIDYCCTNKPSGPSIFKIKSLKLRVGSIVFNKGGYPENEFVNELTTSPKMAVLRVRIDEHEWVSMDRSSKEKSRKGWRFSLFSSAYACSPLEPQPLQAVRTVTITSDTDITDGETAYRAGENLSHLFSQVREKGKDIMLSDYISEQVPGIYNTGNTLLMLRLNKDMDFPAQELTITITLDDGQAFSLMTRGFVVS